MKLAHAKLDPFQSVLFTDDWHFWVFGFFRSSNISFNWSVSWQLWHQSSLTESPAMRKTTIRYIWQRISSPNLAVLISSTSLSLPLSLLRTFLSFSFSFFSQIFLGVPISGQGPRIFPQSVVLKAELLFLATGKWVGRRRSRRGRRQAHFLAANLGSTSVWEKAGETDLMMTEQLCILGTDFSQNKISSFAPFPSK